MDGLVYPVAGMLRAPWQWLRSEGSSTLWVIGLAALLSCAGGLAALVWMPAPQASVIAGILAAIVLLGVWGLQFSTLLRLDHPHAAHLLPGHRRAVRMAALGLWLGGVGVCTGGVLLVGVGLPGVAGLPVLLIAVAAGAVLLWLAMALRWWWMWALIWLPFPAVDGLGLWPVLAAALAPLRGLWLDQPLLWTLVVMVGMGAALCSLFGDADAAHARAYAGRERLRKIAAAGAAGQKPTLAAYGHWGERLGRPFQRLADVWLARVVRCASPQPPSVMARADVVLLGAQHWVRQLAALMLVQLLAVTGFALLTHLTVNDPAELVARGHVGLGIGLASLAITPLITSSGALWMSRREQALLMLLPGMPQGQALNRLLARQQMRHYLLVWLAALPLFLALAWWGDVPQVLGFAGAALPVGALVWHDASRLRAATAMSAFLPYLLCIGLGLSSLLLLRWQPTLLLPWTLGILALSAVLLAWRWQRVSQWPQALPAGRLA
jgi:hypothetical protein